MTDTQYRADDKNPVLALLSQMIGQAVHQPVWPVLAAGGSICIVLGFIALPLGVMGLILLLYLRLLARDTVGHRIYEDTQLSSAQIYAPIDGRIVRQIKTEDRHLIICQPSATDSHLVYAPVFGRCDDYLSFAGRFDPIVLESTNLSLPDQNARRSYQFHTPDGDEVSLDIYAHHICRLVLSFVEEGVQITPSDRLGFGLIMPLIVISVPIGYSLTVAEGQRCLAADTVIARTGIR